MLTSYQNHTITITHTTKGSHARHWFTLFSDETDEPTLINYIIQALESGKQTRKSNPIAIIDNLAVRGVTYDNTLITVFPYWHSNYSLSVETQAITEWSHTYNLEALITVKHSLGCSLCFFASDYALNKNIYRQEKDIQVAITGLAYMLEDFNLGTVNQESDIKFSNDFCGYFPANEPDEIGFIGKISALQEHTLGTVHGYILTVAIALDPESDPSALTLDIFIAQSNVTIDLAIGKHITGLIWLIGSLTALPKATENELLRKFMDMLK